VRKWFILLLPALFCLGCSHHPTAPPRPLTFQERLVASAPVQQLAQRGLTPDWSKAERKSFLFGPGTVAPLPNHGLIVLAARDTLDNIGGFVFIPGNNIRDPRVTLESPDGLHRAEIGHGNKLMSIWHAPLSAAVDNDQWDQFFDCVIDEIGALPNWVNIGCGISIIGCGASGNFVLCVAGVICAVDYLKDCIHWLW
jgi:hypothetical protein